MKELQEIIDEVINQLPTDTNIHVVDKPNLNWKVYTSASGFVNGDYFDLYFTHHKTSDARIEIARTTKNPKYFIKLIKKIDKDIEINYTETTVTYKEVTA